MPPEDTTPAASRALDFTLGRADALAWEVLPSEMTGWRKALFLVFLAAGGLWLVLLPEDWEIDAHDWRILVATTAGICLQWAIATLAMTLAAHRRAARRLPGPVAVRVEDHGDRLIVHERAEGRPERRAAVAVAAIRNIVLGERHLFVEAPPEVLILPLAAFDDREDMALTADLWDTRSRAGED